MAAEVIFGQVKLFAEVKIDPCELRAWPAVQIERFFSGIAQAQDAIREARKGIVETKDGHFLSAEEYSSMFAIEDSHAR